jgi:FlaA1/EpsC-like NDP-sugar epimerase
LDLVLIGLAMFLAGATTHGPVAPSTPSVGGAVATGLPLYLYALVVIVWAVASVLQSVYAPRTLGAIDEAQAVFLAVSLSTLALAGILFFIAPDIPRQLIVVFYFLDLVLLIGSRLLVRLLRSLAGRSQYAKRKVLVLGAGETGRDTVRMIDSHRWAGLEPVGFLDDQGQVGTEVGGYPILGTVNELGHQVVAHGVDEVVVALPIQDYGRFFRLVTELQKLPVRIRLVPDHFKTILFRSRVEEFAGVPMIMVQKPALDPLERQIKRLFDLVLGTITLVATAPLMAIVAIAVRLDSPGPILIRQQRVGEQGKLFSMYKFRSMVKGAEAQQAEATRIIADGTLLHKRPDDPRHKP